MTPLETLRKHVTGKVESGEALAIPELRAYETYCPIFAGFYNTIFDESENFVESLLNDEQEFREHYNIPEEMPWKYITDNFWECVDYQGGNLEVAQSVLEAIPKVFPDGIIHAVEWQAMRSPREYNFANDSIDCKITVNLQALQNYIYENKAAFRGWIRERYTSRDGFISSYPNDFEGWVEDTENFTELDGHYLGSILDFVADLESDQPELDLYYEANTHEAFYNGAEVDVETMVTTWKEEMEVAK